MSAQEGFGARAEITNGYGRLMLCREADARITSLESENASLLTVNANLREALKPFAKHIDEMKFDLDDKGNEMPDDQAVGWVYVTNGDFRRARAALAGHAQAAVGMDWQLSDDAKTHLAEIESHTVRDGDPRLNALICGQVPASPGKGVE